VIPWAAGRLPARSGRHLDRERQDHKRTHPAAGRRLWSWRSRSR